MLNDNFNRILFFKDIIRFLKKRGHQTNCFAYGGSVVQAVQKKNGRVFAFSDLRKGTSIIPFLKSVKNAVILPATFFTNNNSLRFKAEKQQVASFSLLRTIGCIYAIDY